MHPAGPPDAHMTDLEYSALVKLLGSMADWRRAARAALSIYSKDGEIEIAMQADGYSRAQTSR